MSVVGSCTGVVIPPLGPGWIDSGLHLERSAGRSGHRDRGRIEGDAVIETDDFTCPDVDVALTARLV